MDMVALALSLQPGFSTSRIVWLENGGIYAQPNLRGGGEYGEKWHQAGTKMNKQNVFDDFIAAAEYLIKEKYTSSEYLAISGGSNGGSVGWRDHDPTSRFNESSFPCRRCNGYVTLS